MPQAELKNVEATMARKEFPYNAALKSWETKDIDYFIASMLESWLARKTLEG